VVSADQYGCTSAPSDVFTVECVPPDSPVIVAGDGNLFTAAEGDLQWYFNGTPIDGGTTACIDAGAPGEYHVVSADQYGCTSAPSDVFTVECVPPATPVIEVGDGQLCTAAEGDLQWYFNGTPIDGGTTACIDAGAPGEYHVLAADQYGCVSAPSETVVVLPTQVDVYHGPGDVRLAPNPASGHLRIIGLDGPETRYALTDVQGRLVRTGTLAAAPAMDVADLAPGVYVLRIARPEGAVRLRFVKE
jgi:hypothetical protein